jgi:hypothetical protein
MSATWKQKDPKGDNFDDVDNTDVPFNEWGAIIFPLPEAIGQLDLGSLKLNTMPFGVLTTSNGTIVAYETTSTWDGTGLPPDSFLSTSSYTAAAPLAIGKPLVPIIQDEVFVGDSMPAMGPMTRIKDVYAIAGWQFKQEEILNTKLIDWP